MFRFPGVFIAPVAFPPNEIFPFALLVLPFVYNPLYLKEKTKTVLERIPMDRPGSKIQSSSDILTARPLPLLKTLKQT